MGSLEIVPRWAGLEDKEAARIASVGSTVEACSAGGRNRNGDRRTCQHSARVHARDRLHLSGEIPGILMFVQVVSPARSSI